MMEENWPRSIADFLSSACCCELSLTCKIEKYHSHTQYFLERKVFRFCFLTQDSVFTLLSSSAFTEVTSVDGLLV